jgi:hypothetical protein
LDIELSRRVGFDPPVARADPSGALASRNDDAVRVEATRCESPLTEPTWPEPTDPLSADPPYPAAGPLAAPTGIVADSGVPQTLQ